MDGITLGKLANEAGFENLNMMEAVNLYRFGKLVAEAEREECAVFAEGATAYTQFQTIEHYKMAAFISAAIRKRSNVELTGAARHGQQTKLQETEK